MKIHLVSDIHNEFSTLRYEAPALSDVIVCAGDIHVGVAGILWAQDTYGKHNTPVIYVAGNHEFYGKRRLYNHYEKLTNKAQECGIHFLQNKTVIIDGVRFIGATLWTDYKLSDKSQDHAMQYGKLYMNDYRQIYSDVQVPMTPGVLLHEHNKSVSFITEELAKDFDGPTVVVTHHVPSEKSVHERYKGDVLNACFASNLEHIILKYQPELWLHGHVHHHFDYMINKTRVVCNPRGYQQRYTAETTHFNKNLILNVDTKDGKSKATVGG